jgi:hypothetical protein
MLVFILAFIVLLKKRDWSLVPLIIIGMLNRETTILLPLIYAFVRFGTMKPKQWIPVLLLTCAIAIGIYIWLRFQYGIKPPYAPTSPLHYWWTNFTDWKTWLQLIGFFNLTLLLSWNNWRDKPLFLRRVALILPIFILVHFTVGYMREVRYFLPILPILLTFTLLNLEKKLSIERK